jgi:hypothetical protein
MNGIAAIIAAILFSVALSAQDTARVVFYRNRDVKGSLRRTTISIDGKRVCSLVNGRFLELAIPSGEHEFAGPDKKKGAKLRVEAGETYYFGTRSNHERPFQLTDVWAIFPVSREQGSFEVTNLKPLDADDVAPEFRK